MTQFQISGKLMVGKLGKHLGELCDCPRKWLFCQLGLSVICMLIVRVKLEQIQLSRDQNTAVRHEQFRALFLTLLLFIYEVVKCMCTDKGIKWTVVGYFCRCLAEKSLITFH